MARTWCGKRCAVIVLGGILALVVGCSVSVQNHRSVVAGGRSPTDCRLELTDLAMADPGTIRGSWVARGKWGNLWGDDSVTIQATSPDHSFSLTVTAGEFDGTLPRRAADPSGGFSIARSAGVLRFDGDVDGKAWKGPFCLELDPAYVAETATLISGDVSPYCWTVLVLDDVRTEDLRQFRNLGLPLTATDAIRVIHAGLKPDYITALRDAGYRFTLDEWIDLKSQGVSSDYAIAMRQAGYDFTAKELVRLKWQGVSTQYAAGMKEAGYHLTSKELTDLKWQGVSTQYAAGMTGAGYAFTPRELIDLKWQGVSTQYAAGMREAGYGFSPKELIDLKWQGVSTQYAAGMKEAGYAFAPRELIDLKWQGVSTQYAAGMKKAGYDFAPADLIALKWQGVSADYVAALNHADGTRLTAQEIIELRRTGVSPATIRKIRGQR